jgi:signal transduction histidine kinase
MDDRVREYVITLAGGLAHAIKTPLSTMNLNLQLLREDLEKVAEPERTAREGRILKKILLLEREVQRLEDSVNGFLRFVKTESVERQPGSINLLVDELLEFIRPEAESHGIRMHPSLDYRIPFFRFDFEKIRQAILNVVKNGVEAMKEGGDLWVETRQEGGDVTVSVTDSGPGIPEEDRSKIFDLYYSTKPEGTGFGLPTAKRAVEGHDGRIEVFDAQPRGTRFVIRLPMGEGPLRRGSERMPRRG